MDKSLANILLISDKDFEYQTLVEAGYKNVKWFKSTLRAMEYYQDKEKELEKYDLILKGHSALSGVLGHRSYSVIDKVALSYDNDVAYMNFFSSLYNEPGEEKLFYVSWPDITHNGLLKKQFLSILNDVIPKELMGEKILIPEVQAKDVVLPKKREDVKVLFMGYASDNDLVEKYFKGEGLKDYTFIKANNYSLANNIKKLVNYDLVLVDRSYNGGLSLLGDEFQDYMKDKGKSIYFVVYDFNYDGIGVSSHKVKGLPTENPQDLKEIKFDSLETEEDAFKDVLGCALYLYTSYNNRIESGDYPTEEELNNKCREKQNAILEKAKIVNDWIYMLAAIERYLYDYRKYVNEGFKVRPMEGLKVDILQDGVSAAFLIGEREGARITFHDEDCRVGKKATKFYLEYLSEKGKRVTVERTYYDYYDPSKNIANLATDEEMKKVEAIFKRTSEILEPIIREMEEKERKKLIQSLGRGKNKKHM